MAVESCLKRDMEGDFDDSDEDMPLRFKRSAQSSRPSHVSSEVKKSSSQPQRRDGQSGAAREASNLHSPHNGLSSSSNLQKGKVAPPAKPSSMRSPLASPKASSSSGKASPVVNSRTEKQGTSVLSGKVSPMVNSRTEKQDTSVSSGKASPMVNSKTQKQGTSVLSGKVSPMRSSVPNSKASTSVASTSVKVEVESLKRPRQSNSDDEDSDDDKPLVTKIKVNSKWSPPPPQSKTSVKKSPDDSDDEDSFDDTPLSAKIKMNSRLSPRPPQPKTSVKKSPDDSDDEKPLKSKYPLKSSAGSSGTKPSDFDDKKPLATKLQQNGSAGRDNQGKSSTVPSKRPVEKPNPSSQLLASKKPKLSGTSLPARVKEVSVKAETKKPVKLDNVSSTKSNTSKPASSSKAQEKASKDSKYSKSTNVPPSSGDGQKKWTTLAHNGVIFPPPYQPHGVKILYRGKPVDLTPEQEEVATMYAMMIDTDYMQKEKFKENFWEDWRKILGRKHVIQSLEDCDFTPIYDWYQKEKEKKKQMSSEEKKILKEEKFKQEEKYMWAVVDGVKEKVGNFRVEPPGLFRGRGEHPKMGKLKRRIHPSDITINIGKDAPVPECPIPGENWKEIRNDNTVTWLAFWNDPINPKEFKYVFLAASSSLKGQSDKEKYEKARLLKGYIENIRTAYTKAFTSKDVTKQQIAVATYLIDKLALRAGNEKDDDEADTVGCCTLKIENVTALPQSNKLEFNFLGKDSIKYENVVEVEPLVYKAILQFQTGKKEGDDLFDQLDTSKLNAHLKELMPGLTAKVFRTYNASITLDKMLYSETKDGDVPEKVAVYNYANKQVAIICNHQRSISKSHATQMTKLKEKLNDLKGNLKELRTDLDRAKKGKPPLRDADGKQKRNLSPEALEKKMAQINVKIEKTERDMKTKEDLKTVALGTSKINYLDSLLVIMWSCFISLTSMTCLVYLLLSMGAAGAAVQYLGYTPGLFIVGLIAILILWMYANFWITGILFTVGGYLFSLNHARLVVFMATIYAIYSVKVRVGWFGVFLSINLSFLSNDVFNYLLQWCDNVRESRHFEEQKEPETVAEDFSEDCGYTIPPEEPEMIHPCKSSSKPASTTSVINNHTEASASKVVREETNSIDEMKRILNSVDHYEALGFPRHKKIDVVLLKKEYRKKAMLVHPDKNMGSPIASDSFKKLQCAYEVLSDSVKKRDYDEQLKKEESRSRSVCHKSHSSSSQEGSGYCSEESRRIHCTKCGHSHIWVCTNRSKTKARWCQDCCQYHQAKDGDGWVEYKGSLVFDKPQKVEIPRAFVCAESKVFDVSEWAICQGMACRPNTHRPSFHVNMVGLEKSTQRSNSSRYPWDLDAEQMEDDEEFELWLQQALASGLFCETSKRRKSWSPFNKLNQKKGKKQWRRSSYD